MVYPRVCGGTYCSILFEVYMRGLSPRVRGNLRRAFDNPVPHGSIPACAGEPRRRTARLCLERVYPRVCGGTRYVAGDNTYDRGLSPRVRGNPCW